MICVLPSVINSGLHNSARDPKRMRHVTRSVSLHTGLSRKLLTVSLGSHGKSLCCFHGGEKWGESRSTNLKTVIPIPNYEFLVWEKRDMKHTECFDECQLKKPRLGFSPASSLFSSRFSLVPNCCFTKLQEKPEATITEKARGQTAQPDSLLKSSQLTQPM